jgi:hypothetical protein
MTLRRLVAALLLLSGAQSAIAAQVDPMQHLNARSDRYDVTWSGIPLGEGVISLKPQADGCFLYESSTDPIALVRWTYGAPRETSQFCLQDGRIVSQQFSYDNDKREKDSFRLDFDWDQQRVRTLRAGEMTLRDLPEQAYDRFVIREAVRMWVIRNAAGEAPDQAEFVLVNEDRIRSYKFAVIGPETVSTPAGTFETIRVDRVDSETRPFHYWFAPSRDYIPVKLEHLKKDKVELRMTLIH